MKTVAHPGSRGVTTALIYTRVSSDDQAREGVSLDAQLAECRRYAAGKGWVLGHEYQDVLSGTRDDRPYYQALLTDARRLRSEGHSVAVVVTRLDRFGRRVLERVRCREELKGLGVSTHSVREGGEVSDLVAGMLAVVAEDEVQRLGQRVRDAWDHIRSNGWARPGRPPLGYCWRPATDEERRRGAPKVVLDVHPDEAPIAREMFERVAAGESVRSVARWLASLPSDLRGGRACGFPAARRLLSSNTYIARLDDAAPGNWPALVSDDLFERVQGRIRRHGHVPAQASGKYLLTGLIHCPECGTRMTGATRGRSGPPRYTCRGPDVGAAGTEMAATCWYSANAAKLDHIVRGETGSILNVATSAEPALRTAIRRAWKTLSQPARDGAGLERAHAAAAAKARDRIRRLALLFADGDLDRQGYELGRAQAQADLEAAEGELERLHGVAAARTDIPSLDEVLRAADDWRVVLASADVGAQRDILADLIDRVVPERVSFGTFRVRVAWTPLGEHLRALVQAASVGEEAA